MSIGRLQSRIKQISINLLIFFITLLVTLSFIEIVLRLIFPVSERNLANIHQADESLGWSYVANSEQWYSSPGEFRNYIKINANGLRDVERSYVKPDGTYRVMVLGDSFVASLQVPLNQTFVQLAETKLNQENFLEDRTVEVLNAGVGAYGTDQELRWFRQEGVKYFPDMVILVIFLGNDIANNDAELSSLATVSTLPPKPFFTIEEGKLVDIGYVELEARDKQTFNLVKVRRFLQEKSYLFSIGNSTLTQLTQNPKFISILGLLGSNLAGNNYNHAYDIFAEANLPEWERAWDLTEALILTLKKETEALGADFRVVLIPHPVQVHQDLWDSRVALYPAMAEKEWDLQKPNKRLQHFFEKNDISYLDLLTVMKSYAEENNGPLFYSGDGHLTKTAHPVVSEAITEWLLANLPNTSGR